jgi:hypothetical protein
MLGLAFAILNASSRVLSQWITESNSPNVVMDGSLSKSLAQYHFWRKYFGDLGYV